MPKKVTVTCDTCERDLSVSGGADAYRLVLAPEKLPHPGGVHLDIMVYPPIDRTHYFCGLGCLARWVDANRPAGVGSADE